MKRILLIALVFGIVFSVYSQESKRPYVILIPSFPSKIFPNHYTIATGMKPEHHGLVDNSFYDSAKDLVYTMGNRGMHGIFYASGPSIKEGLKTDQFENIHVYPLICKIFGLPIPAEVDGKSEVLDPILKD